MSQSPADDTISSSRRKKDGAQKYFPASKIKAIMQNNPNVGKISKVVPELISTATYSFIQELLSSGVKIAHDDGRAVVTVNDLQSALKEQFGPLSDALEGSK